MKSPVLLMLSLALALVAMVPLSPAAMAHPLQGGGDNGQLGLSIGPGDSTFAVGQPIGLTFVVRNEGQTVCDVPQIADGSLMVTALERDGDPVFPMLASRYYSDGLGEAVREALAPLAAGASREFQLGQQAGSRMFVRSVNYAASGRSALALWPIDEPGAYRLTAVYRIADVTGGACPGAATASVDFRIAAAGGLPLPVLILVIVGLFLLGGVAALLLLRRRDRRSVGTALLLPLVLSASFLEPASVLGVIEVAPGDSALSSLVGGCFAQFRAPGGDPAGVFRALEASSQKARIEPIAVGKPSTDSADPASSQRGTSTNSLIYINPDYTGVYADGVAHDQCSALYHEMSHALDFATGTDNPGACGNTGIAVAEVKAVLNENRWRAAHNLPSRTKYGGKTIPASLDDCRRKQPAGARRPGGKRGIDCDDDCGSSNGDPHLGTFDRRFYNFQAAGEFVLARSPDRSFEIQARQVPFPGSSHVSVNSALAFGVAGNRIGFYSGVGESARGVIEVLVDGVPADVGEPIELSGGGSLERADDESGSYFVEWPDGSLAWIGEVGAWGVQTVIQPAAIHRGALAGLLGNFDGDKAREFFTRAGAQLDGDVTFERIHREFGDGWRLLGGESLFDYAAGESTTTFTVPDFPRAEIGVDDVPGLDLLRAACLAEGLNDEEFIRQCIIDLALTGQWDFGEGAGSAEVSVAGGGQPSGPAVPIASALPSTGAQARVVNLYTENGQPVEVDVYAYTWSQTEIGEAAALVATVPYGQASDWFNPGLVQSPFDEEPYTSVRIFRHGDQSQTLVGIGEFLGPGTVTNIVVWQEEVFEGQPGAWSEAIYAQHPDYPIPQAPADKGLLVTRNSGLDAEGEPPILYLSAGDGCLESPIPRSYPDIPNVQPIGNDLVIAPGPQTLTVHGDAPIGELPDCSDTPLGPGLAITVSAGERLLASPHRLPGATEMNLLVLPFDI